MDILCRKGVVTTKWSKSDRNALETTIANCRDLGKRADDTDAAALVEPLEALRRKHFPISSQEAPAE